MLISNSLLVNADSRNGQHSIFLLQPSRIQLVIWDNPEENHA